MKLELRVSQRARNDIDGIFDWIAKRSPDGARRWYDLCFKSMESLRDSSLGSGIAPEADRLGIDLRQYRFKTRRGHWYRLLFMIESATIQIVGVRGAGQDDVGPADIELPS